MLNKQDQASWKQFFAVAEAFQEIAPWRWMEDRHIFRIHCTIDDELYYCSILGNGGEVFGLCMYPGEVGLASLLSLYEAEMYDGGGVPPLSLYEQRCLRLDITEIDYLPEDYRELYQQLGREIGSGEERYIVLQDIHPGLVPKQPSPDKVAVATEVLTSALELAKNYQHKVATLDRAMEMNTLPARYLNEQGQPVIEYVKMPEVELLWTTQALPALTVRSITKLPVQDQIQVLLIFHIPGQVIQESPDEDAFYPLIILWVNGENGMIEDLEISQPQELKVKLLSIIATKFSEQGFRPSQLAVSDPLVAKAVMEMCQQLGITLLIAPSELVNEIFNSLAQRLMS
ncbi:MAG: hypothetical protein D6772_17675 [Bacteroidetes bacterium]|nr:MAG: hypothetical protein D6772_17675 [Bacteroidota bacterium]